MPVTSKKSRAGDIHEIERRLEMQIHLHLLDMEENPEMYAAKDRLAAIQYIGMYLNRKFGWGDPEVEGVGSAVRKYAGAFKTTPHVVSGRAERARPAANRGYSDSNPEDDAA